MRKLAVLLMMTGLALPACAAKRVTVNQLERLLSADHGKADAKIAQQLSDLELTERLSADQLSRWESDLPGPESRRSMLILADESAFLDPPAAEVPTTAAPDLAAQRKIMALAIGYTTKTFSKLPDFFATRDTIFFEDTPQTYRADTSVIPYQSLHPVSRSSDRVLYRDGREVVDSGAPQAKQKDQPNHGLTTSGVFGPILGTVLVDAAQGKLAWSHWEQGAVGPLAVFHFVVPKEKSHYEVEFCCVPGENGNRAFQQYSGYHGEIAVDPANGAILRLTLQADLKRTDPLVRSDIMVEYGSVEIGGKVYICPLKSVSITLAPVLPADAGGLQRYRGQFLEKDINAAGEHLQTLLNDASFAQYHVFRTESRILPGDSTDAGAPLPAPSAADSRNSSPPEPAAAPGESTPAEPAIPAAPAVTTSAPTPAQPAAAEAPVPEINVTESAGLPAATAIDVPTTGSGFTLHVTSRLVNVGVVAVDKKGHAVTDLKPEDFEIYDNGRKQSVQFLTRAGEEFNGQTSLASGQSGPPPAEIVYSNRHADTADAEPRTGTPEGTVTILLIDAGSTAWADLTYARGEMLKFLERLPAEERVGLYVQNAHGFQVLVEETRDHALLESTLRKWMPGAQDLARAQEMEQRNRQQFDDVLNSADLQSVNGNISTAPDTATGVDPNLRDNGSNPGLSAMATLVSVARHLAAIPGHKNLVWVASDNVLVNWTDKAVGSDKGGKNIDAFVLHAQEALNDAQVSIYPLDTSQLETAAIDPSLKNQNIQLSPSVTAPPPAQGGGQAPGRIAAEMQQDIRPIRGPIQEMAEATGGRVFRRSGNIAENLNTVIADGRATYLLGFAPDTPADDRLHRLTLKLPDRRGVSLRYRTGYLYAREPAALKERFQQAIWQSVDLTEIAISAKPIAASEGATVKLNIAANDVALIQQGENWMDKLDVFLVLRDDEGSHARITGQTLRLVLKPATHERLLREGIPFDQFVEKVQGSGSVRIIVVDENSGRMGSVTLPALALQQKN